MLYKYIYIHWYMRQCQNLLQITSLCRALSNLVSLGGRNIKCSAWFKDWKCPMVNQKHKSEPYLKKGDFQPNMIDLYGKCCHLILHWCLYSWWESCPQFAKKNTTNLRKPPPNFRCYIWGCFPIQQWEVPTNRDPGSPKIVYNVILMVRIAS